MNLLLSEEEIMELYIESEKYEALQEGLRKGRQEGLHEARQEGRQKGRQEGRQEERIEMTKRLLKQGKMTLEEISVITSLSLKELETLIQPSSN